LYSRARTKHVPVVRKYIKTGRMIYVMNVERLAQNVVFAILFISTRKIFDVQIAEFLVYSSVILATVCQSFINPSKKLYH